MSRFAMLTNTDRVTPDGAGRTASATIAWLRRSRPTWSTLTLWSSRVAGLIASAASVATRISASPTLAASALARFSASPRSPVDGEMVMPSMAARTRPRSLVPFTTTRAVRPAAMTLTVPFAGRSCSLARTCALASVSRSGGMSVAPMLADVSITTTTSPASPAGRSRNGPAAELGEYELRERQVGRDRDVGRAAARGEVGKRFLPCGQPGLVVVERREVDGHIEAVAGLHVDQPYVALDRWIELVGREDVQHDELR